MMRLRRQRLIGSVVLVGVASMGWAAEPALQQCQKLKDKIEHYDQLRRKGGKGSEMDSWKRSRRELEKAFRAQGCHYYRRELK
ncbi:hypothetical protein [Pseudohalioglobus lutimaris]|uniref:Uncharacterized protein n=1 Tax=Pseudohalioglobus lutimaris TaxID=1737061 RepID=A0A2N5WXV7_9GAMM|nr:hypothetical protein [Pseudohalioglobus lutimaris]PLW67072.1 hypothetical protein C0039_18820 [Pseudohalioglobus lutimaris]